MQVKENGKEESTTKRNSQKKSLHVITKACGKQKNTNSQYNDYKRKQKK